MSWESFGCCCAATLCCPTTSVLWRCSSAPVIEFPSGGNYLTANGATPTAVTLAPSIYADQTLTRINGPFQRCSYRKIGLQTVGNPVVGGSLWVTFNGVSRPTAAYLPWWYVQAVQVTSASGTIYVFWEAAVSLKLYYGTGFPNPTYTQHGSITLGRTTAIPSTGCPMNLLYRRGNPAVGYPWFGEITSGGLLNTQTPNAPYHDPGSAGSTVEYATSASSFQVSIV
jgi:hypothetical protein